MLLISRDAVQKLNTNAHVWWAAKLCAQQQYSLDSHIIWRLPLLCSFPLSPLLLSNDVACFHNLTHMLQHESPTASETATPYLYFHFDSSIFILALRDHLQNHQRGLDRRSTGRYLCLIYNIQKRQFLMIPFLLKKHKWKENIWWFFSCSLGSLEYVIKAEKISPACLQK